MQRSEIRNQIRIATLVDSANITDVELNTIINQGLFEVSTAFPWPWLEKVADLSLVADTQTVNLPADFDYGIVLVDDDHDTYVTHVAAKRFFELTGNASQASKTTLPRFWTIFDNKIYLYPTPSTADSDRLSLYYYQTVDPLAADGDSPPFHEAFHWILVEYSKWKVYEREEYYDQSERSFITYSRYLNEMIAFYGNRVKKAPFLWGEGGRGRRAHPNLPILDEL